MRPLKALYKQAGMDVGDDGTQQFFQRTLRIPNISHKHIIDELEHMVGRQPDTDTVRNLYRMLQEMYETDQDIAESLR